MLFKIVYTLFPLAFCLQVMAIDVYQIESKKRYGNIHYSLIISEQNIKIVKNTNLFDMGNEFKAGIAIVTNGNDLKKEFSSFKNISTTLEKIKKKLPRKFKVEKSIVPHGEYYVIRGHKITRDNFLYSKVRIIFDDFLGKVKMKIVDGIKIKKDKFYYLEKSKMIEFPLNDLKCGGDLPPKLCSSQKYGFIYK